MTKRFRGGVINANLIYTSVDVGNAGAFITDAAYTTSGLLYDTTMNARYQTVRINYTRKLDLPSLLQYVVVAGGGGGAGEGGGGGGGGFLANSSLSVVSGSTYVVTVGAGGLGGNPGSPNAAGSNSRIISPAGNVIAVYGGSGNSRNVPVVLPNGGSGGGGGALYNGGSGGPGGTGISGQGYPGGVGLAEPINAAGGGAGGGGAGGAGETAPFAPYRGRGGNGSPTWITGANIILAGGGGGGGVNSYDSGGGAGGTGGGGGGKHGTSGGGGSPTGVYSAIAALNTYGPGRLNSGGGGGGGTGPTTPGDPLGTGYNGGSGIVIISHPNAYKQGTTTGSNITISSNVISPGNIIYQFYSSGTIIWN